MPIGRYNENANGSVAPQIIPASIREYKKSEYLFRYMYRTEGMTPGTVAEIALPGIYGVENLKTLPEYNTGTDVAEQIKRQNEYVLLIQENAPKLLKEPGDSFDIEIKNGVFIRVFKPKKEEENTLENSQKNFYHEEIKIVVNKKVA